jgi:uncharacterized damage-inducible protein DinB
MTSKQILLDQLADCHNRNGWFVSLESALRGLDTAQASHRSAEGQHTIRELVDHLLFWNERYLLRFRAQAVSPVSDNDATFGPQGAGGAAGEWSAVRSRLDRVMAGLREEIESSDDAKLSGRVQPDAEETWYAALARTALHTAHHVGQIVTLRKQQGSWDPKQGVS